MEHLVSALWRPPTLDSDAVHRHVLDEWAPSALADPGVEALTVFVADVDQGGYRNGPDVVVVLGLGAAHDLDAFPDRDALHAVASRFEVWRVAANNPKRYDRDWPDGTASPGVTMISLMQRSEGVSHAQFVRHWNERHTPLALRHHVGLWDYHQYAVRRAFTPGGASVDGIATLHFRTRADYEDEFFDSDEGRAVIMADVDRFMRLDRSQAALATEHVLRSGS